MNADMSVFMGHLCLGSLRVANILNMYADMSVSIGTCSHIRIIFLS